MDCSFYWHIQIKQQCICTNTSNQSQRLGGLNGNNVLPYGPGDCKFKLKVWTRLVLLWHKEGGKCSRHLYLVCWWLQSCYKQCFLCMNVYLQILLS